MPDPVLSALTPGACPCGIRHFGGSPAVQAGHTVDHRNAIGVDHRPGIIGERILQPPLGQIAKRGGAAGMDRSARRPLFLDFAPPAP
jgi:hypothetical protein